MSIHEILADIQSKLIATKGQTNAFGKYKYRSCEDILMAVKPRLAEHGAIILLSDEVIEVGGQLFVKSTACSSRHCI